MDKRLNKNLIYGLKDKNKHMNKKIRVMKVIKKILKLKKIWNPQVDFLKFGFSNFEFSKIQTISNLKIYFNF